MRDLRLRVAIDMDRAAPETATETNARLAGAEPSDRTEFVLELIEGHPQKPLALPSHDGVRAMLDEIDLSRGTLAARLGSTMPSPAWWSPTSSGAMLAGADLRGVSLRLARLQGIDLTEADLQEAQLGEADLRDAMLEGANLQDADLAGSVLTGAVLSGARLRGAMMEESNLRDSTLRFADLKESVLEGADLQGADLWGSTLDNAVLVHANMRGARFQEASLRGASLANADLQFANFGKADLTGVSLEGADLRGATLEGATLHGAVLRDAKLQGVDLSSCDVSGVRLSGAWLDQTMIHREQLGEAIGDELDGQYVAARRGYLALERNFTVLGDPDAASWAYRKRRRMQKLAARGEARSALREGLWTQATGPYARYLSDALVERLCDYGESIPRVLQSMLIVYISFALIYGLTGSVVRVEEGADRVQTLPTGDVLDLAIFSLLAMTTSGSPVVGLVPRHEAVHVLTGLEALLGIFLTGLLGFVVGNRIRR